jgi:hypothetical protein
MEALMTRPARGHRPIGGAVLMVALAALIGGLSVSSAHADDRGRRDRHPPHRAYGYAAPAYVYAPPPVYYAPPPPPPAIDFVIPLNFR